MKRTSVESSNVTSIGYDPQAATLHVEYSHGGVYAYSGVTEEDYAALMESDSIGRHLATHIKGNFPHERVLTEPPVSS